MIHFAQIFMRPFSTIERPAYVVELMALTSRTLT